MPDFDKQHRNNMRKYVAQTEKEYLAFADTVSRVVDDPKAKFQKSFKFVNNIEIQKKVDKATNGFAANLLSIVSKGIDTEWKLSDSKNDIQLKNTLKVANKLGAEGYNPHNADALKKFLDRKENGMGISDRVWKNASGFRDELEKHIQLGILNGDSADAVSRRIRQNLNEPDKLFRRVRDKNGNLVFSKKALDYRPGRGVYRSSYANARRLVVTETNMAFRRADHERWKNDPKVIGFEVKLSGNHPTNDICDQLKGTYPKTFLWTGWHPQCRCYATPILLSDRDFNIYQDSILEDKPFDPTSATGFVDELPKAFTEWAEQNKERLEVMAENGKTPTFIRDNFKDGRIGKGLSPVQQEAVATEGNVKQIKTEAQKQDIQSRWNERQSKIFKPAKTIKEAEEFGKTLAGNVSYKGVSIEAANQWNESVFNHLAKFPELKEGLKFIGTIQERNKFWISEKVRMEIGADSEFWKNVLAFKKGDVTEAKKYVEKYFRGRIKNVEYNVTALSSKDPIVGGVSMNANFFKNLESAKESLKRNVATNFHPIGCDTVKSVIDHELGHQIDNLLKIRSNLRVIDLVKKYDAVSNVSKYAATNIDEFIAECWSEYLNNPSPRRAASELGKIIEDEYGKIKK